ncbi:MAG TPA: UDP-N-acetylmuramate--alanine ligase [Rhodobacteraceae bacterium]|jgi:hypothetical protein|nr:UDP-N-acetylmuramate--alanine ligase [Paracoccaceae bacterium]
MSTAAISAALWVLAATGTAFLPMRRQYAPGLGLLLLAPGLILWLGAAHGWGWSVAALLGFLSMFRNPLRYLWRKARGEGGET